MVSKAQVMDVREESGPQAMDHVLGGDHQPHEGEFGEHRQTDHDDRSDRACGEYEVPVRISAAQPAVEDLLDGDGDYRRPAGHHQCHQHRYAQTGLQFGCGRQTCSQDGHGAEFTQIFESVIRSLCLAIFHLSHGLTPTPTTPSSSPSPSPSLSS